MTLAAEQGAKIIVKIDGQDEQMATDELTQLFASGFGE
jgi:phosphotransferase system HPr-like phosphotransfer protein